MPFLTLLLNPRVLGALAGLVLITTLVVGIYEKGVHTERAKWELLQAKAQAQSEERARKIEQEKAAEAERIDHDHAEKIKALDAYYQSYIGGLSMRIKVGGGNGVSKASGTATKPHGPAAASGCGASEIDLTGIAREVAELGHDLDACSAQVVGLQDVIKSYTANHGGK